MAHPVLPSFFRYRLTFAPWLLALTGAALAVLAPVTALVVFALQGSPDLWPHLLRNVLPVTLVETGKLLLGVGMLVTVIGAGTAWLVTAYDFPGRRIFLWALLLPLAVPTYIVAYAYLDILHPVGPVQTALRAVLGYTSPRQLRLPDVRSMSACILMLGFVLYPYVYLTTRAMFMTQAAGLIEAARILGTHNTSLFFRIALPLARPAIAVGVSLALMETLNDIGASEFLGVRTLSVSIYSTWVTRSDLPGAAQIALVMLVIVTMLVLAERWLRRHKRYAASTKRSHPLKPVKLQGVAAIAAGTACLLPVAIGFLAPAAYLLSEAVKRMRFGGVSQAIIHETLNTLAVAAFATFAAGAVGLAVTYSVRLQRSGGFAKACARVSSLGYAMPGTVLAIGLLPVIGAIDYWLDDAAQALGAPTSRLWLLGSGAALVIAYTIRFLAITIGGSENGFARISPSLDDAARTLGRSAGFTLWRIHLPILTPALAAAALLVFVDAMKELPATLLLRPLNFETLATHLYGEAARGTYEEASIAALLIVVAGLAPVIVLARAGEKG